MSSSTAQSLAEDTGGQIAFQAIPFNRLVIGEAVRSVREDVFPREPGIPWSQWAAMRDAIGAGRPAVPAAIPPHLTDDLAPVEESVLRLRSAPSGAS